MKVSGNILSIIYWIDWIYKGPKLLQEYASMSKYKQENK